MWANRAVFFFRVRTRDTPLSHLFVLVYLIVAPRRAYLNVLILTFVDGALLSSDCFNRGRSLVVIRKTGFPGKPPLGRKLQMLIFTRRLFNNIYLPRSVHESLRAINDESLGRVRLY